MAVKFKTTLDASYLSYDFGASPPIASQSSYSWSVWFKAISSSVAQELCSIGKVGNNSAYFSLILTAGGALQAIDRGLATTTHAETTGTDYADGEWHLVAGTVEYVGNNDDFTVRVYVDGSLVATVPITATSPTNPPTYHMLRLGARHNLANIFDGWLEDAAFYLRLLTGPEIESLWNSYSTTLLGKRASTLTTPPDHHWTLALLAGNAGQTVSAGADAILDTVGSADLTITGAPLYSVGPGFDGEVSVASAYLVSFDPEWGEVGRASRAIELTPNGTVPATETVTPDDGGAGGTFSPTSCVGDGSADSFSFTYTPATSGSVTIGFSSTTMTDPGDIAFTARIRPSPRSTGPRNAMSASSSLTITADDSVVENLDVSGAVIIQANNVTVRDCRVDGTGETYGIRVDPGYTGVVIDYVEVFGANTGIRTYSSTLTNSNIHDTGGDGVAGNDGSVIEGNWIHNLGTSTGDDAVWGTADDPHSDGVQQADGSCTIRGNYIDMPEPVEAPYHSNNCLLLSPDVATAAVQQNWLDGGHYTLQVGAVTEDVKRNEYGPNFGFGLGDSESGAWTNTDPRVLIVSPTASTSVSIGESLTVELDKLWARDNFKVELSRNNGSSWETLSEKASFANTWQWAWVVDGAVASQAKIRVTPYILNAAKDAEELSGTAITSDAFVIAEAIPAAPSALTATAASATAINLGWTNNATNATAIKVYRSTDGETFALLDTAAADATSYSDTTCEAGTKYYYYVVATNAAGDSAASNTANATTEAAATPTRYVATTGSDSADGSEATPWRTLQHAVDSAVPGDLIQVAAGSYAGFTATGSDYGSSTDPITLQAGASGDYRTSGVTVNAFSATDSNHYARINIEANDGHYILKGFNVTDTGSTQKAGIRIADAPACQVLSCSVSGAFTGIFASFADGIVIQDCLCHDANDEHGIYVNGTDGYTIRGNTCYANPWDGIHTNIQDDTPDSPNANGLIEANIVRDNVQSGFNFTSMTGATVRNNLAYGNGKHAMVFQNMGVNTHQVCSDNLVVNNTLLCSNSGSEAQYALQFTPDYFDATVGNGRNTTVFNNILLGGNPGYQGANLIVSHEGSPAALPTGFASDYNILASDTTMAYYEGAAETFADATLAEWRLATSQDAHSIESSAAALFTSPATNTYTLKAGSPALDAGVSSFNSQSAPATDLAGTDRGTPDIGAYEVDEGTPANAAPTVTISSGAGTYDRGDTVSLAASAADAEDGNLSASIAWSSDRDGALGSGASLSLSDLSVGTHTITASVTDSDGASGSDEITVIVQETVPAAPGDLTATAISPARVDLTWTDNSDNETAFVIERKEAGGEWSVVHTT